ncbi:helix-turn-helix domain-containing protein [Bacillus sp. T33-2]|uniref:helix-turn-helix domain-containing protein n=1 Tax=Bacillus sp. T33-2 TaxID=2054168 RepID=UPI000C7826BF|nr:helix-turn-helix domain-containing protein [Bacillus sp. T33-2]PLR93221.1 hypothetical protein CVD19_19650 [Bacillus sp. T33-2]
MAPSKIHPRHSGPPRFGTGGNVEKWDNSVKVSYLSPEELQKYRNGEHGGIKLFTYDDFLRLKAEGKSNEEIAKEMKMSPATLYKRIKAWKMDILQGKNKDVQAPKENKELLREKEAVPPEKPAQLEQLVEGFKGKLKAAQDECQQKDKTIEELNNKVSYWQQRAERAELQPVDQADYESLEKELVAVREELQSCQELFDEVSAAKENAAKEILTLNNQVNRLSEALNERNHLYENLLEQYKTLQQEIGPIRQLAFLKLQQDVSLGG